MNSHPEEQLTWNKLQKSKEKTRNDLPKVMQLVADSELKPRSVTCNPVPCLLHQMAKIAWHQQNLNKYCKKFRATNVYYCFPNGLKLSYKVESALSKNLSVNVGNITRPSESFLNPPLASNTLKLTTSSLLNAIYPSLLFLLNHTGLFFFIIWWRDATATWF